MQPLDEQINTVERALGERMINHALVVLRAWLTELGENNPFEQAYNTLRSQYDQLASEWPVSENQEGLDEQLSTLTGDAFRLVDAAYVAIRLFRGLSPHMRGYNNESAPSVMHYFANCLEFKEEDFKWLKDVMNDSQRASLALVAVAALAKNLRECFCEEAIMTLIEGINAENAVVAEQCLASLILLFAHYDARIDFFPQLQTAFWEAVDEMGDEGRQAFETMFAIVRSAKENWLETYAVGEASFNDLPEEIQDLLNMTGAKNEVNSFRSWIPASEKEYISGIVEILPHTWICEQLINEDRARLNSMTNIYLVIGSMEMAWDNLDIAEEFLVRKLRYRKPQAIDLMHYAHCLLLRGDRLMALENYKRARGLCASTKDFYNLFRPERKQLADRGVPLEHIYFIEDQILMN